MMESPTQKPRQPDEIDISQIMIAIGRFFNRLGNGTLFFLALLRNLFFNNRLFFAGIIVTGLILGGLYSELLKKKYYKSTMVLSCDYLNTQILSNTIDKFNLLCEEREREGLADLLGIDQKTAKNVQKFAFEPFVSEDDVVEMEVLRTQLNAVVADKKDLVEKVMAKLEIENKNAYEISVQVYDPNVVKPLEKALIKYFSTGEYVKKRINSQQRTLTNRMEKLQIESRKLDSLKRVIYENYQMFGKTSRGSNNVILSDEQLKDPLAIYKQDLEINQEILEIERTLAITPDFEVVDGFTSFKEPESASLWKVLVISFFLAIVIGYLIIGAWKFDKMLSRIDTKSKD
ncbi:MAG TPA: hypothetical protein VGD65_19460 [Chryseosolibacter sp.]